MTGRRFRRFLRSPRLIVAELLAIALVAVASTLITQEEQTSLVTTTGVATPPSGTPAWVHALALDHLLTSAWFLGPVGLAAASLLVVQVDQWRALVARLRTPLTWDKLSGAPYRREFVRAAQASNGVPLTQCFSRGSLTVFGSPLFHLGLVLVLVAGLWRMLAGRDAAISLIEGEAIPATAEAYGAQWGGRLSRPFALAASARLERLRASRYPSGEVRGLSAKISIGEGQRTPAAREIAINDPLKLGAERLYLTSTHGPAALIEISTHGKAERRAILLRGARDSTTYEAVSALAGGLELRLRATISTGGDLPRAIETRILRDGALLFIGRAAVGTRVDLGAAGYLVLHDVRYWVELRGSRDRALWLALGGMSLVLLGTLLMFALVRVDFAVRIAPTTEGERVTIAMRPHRYVPLFAEHFEAFARAQGYREGSEPRA